MLLPACTLRAQRVLHHPGKGAQNMRGTTGEAAYAWRDLSCLLSFHFDETAFQCVGKAGVGK